MVSRHRPFATCIAALRLSLILLLLAPAIVSALQVSVDRNTVPLNETVRLEIRSNTSRDLDKVDLGEITRHFEIAGSSSQSEFSMVNGRTESVQKLTLTLAPTALGKFTIPPLEHKGRSSDALTINVVPAVAPPDQLDDRSIRVEAELDKYSAQVNEQVIYTFRVIYRVGLDNAEITTLDIPGAEIKNLPDANYQRVINGQTYQIVEKRYALFFADPGSQSITGQTLSAVVGANRSRFGFGLGTNPLAGGQRVRLGVEPLQLTIEKIPPAAHGKHWLPAQTLQLREIWPAGNDNAVVGQPLTRSIEIFAKGLTGEQLPAPTSAAIDGLNSYPETPAFISEPWSGGIAGKRIDTFALIPTRAGRFTLPAIEVHWWNTQTQRAEIARLPARTFSVAPAPVSEQQPEPKAPAAAVGESPALQTPAPLQQSPLAQPPSLTQTGLNRWRALALISTAGWLLTLLAVFFWVARLRRDAAGNAHSNTPEHTQENAAGRLQAAAREVKRACRSNNAAAAKVAIDHWLQAYARARNIAQNARGAPTSEAVLAALGNTALQRAWAELNRYLYGAGASGDWRGEQLQNALACVQTQPERDALLPPLYPGTPRGAGNPS